MALTNEGINKQTFASQRDIEPWQVSRFLTPGGLMTKAIKDCIFNGWASPCLSLELLDAHIQDEIESAGFADKIKQTPIPEILKVLKEVLSYIEKTEDDLEYERGCGRSIERLIELGDMPDEYSMVRNLIDKLEGKTND